MRARFPYDIGSIHRKLMTSAVRHSDSCRAEIVRLRALLAEREAEIERLCGQGKSNQPANP